MKKKYVLKNKSRFITIVIIFVLLFFTTIYASSVYGYKEINYRFVTVRNGDTLWDIANDYRKNCDIRKYIYKIREINNLKDSIIYEGDILKLPQ